MITEYQKQVRELWKIYDEFTVLLDNKDSNIKQKFSDIIKQLEVVHKLTKHKDNFTIIFCVMLDDACNGKKPNNISTEELLRILSIVIRLDLFNISEDNLLKYDSTIKYILWLLFNVCFRLNIELDKDEYN